MARALTVGKEEVRPALMALQVDPPVVLLKTPPAHIPAYRVVGVFGSIAMDMTCPPSGPPPVQAFVPSRATLTVPTHKSAAATRSHFFNGHLSFERCRTSKSPN